MKYEVVYTRTITKIVEVEQHSHIFTAVHDHQPVGFDVQDWCHIQDDEHLTQVLAEVKAQELLS